MTELVAFRRKIMAVSVRLDPEIEQRLDQLVAQTGRAKSYYLRELIEGGLDELEDFYLADAAMERVRRGREKLLDASQVRTNLGLDH
jgi:RHH-type transcriptional regulator, rel operon repressor / antitoxin RelB